MSEEIVPFEFESHQVRTVVVDGEPWFVAHDIAKVLGYRSAPDMTRRLEESDKGHAKVRIRQTLYLKAFVLPDLQKRVEASWRS